MLTQPCIKSVTLATGSSSNAASGSIYIESGKSWWVEVVILLSNRAHLTKLVEWRRPYVFDGRKRSDTDEDTGKAGGMVRIDGGLSTVGDGGTLSIAGDSSEIFIPWRKLEFASGQLVDEQLLYGTTYFTQIYFFYICVW